MTYQYQPACVYPWLAHRFTVTETRPALYPWYDRLGNFVEMLNAREYNKRCRPENYVEGHVKIERLLGFGRTKDAAEKMANGL